MLANKLSDTLGLNIGLLLSPSLRALLRALSLALLFVSQYGVIGNAIADTATSAETQQLRIAMLAAETRFSSNTMELTPAGQRSLQDLIISLDKFHEIISIRFIGHTDNIGSIKLNQSLSLQRANAIRSSFASKYSNTHLIAFGMGELQPIAKNDTEEGRKRNRRVEIQVIAKGYMPASLTPVATKN